MGNNQEEKKNGFIRERIVPKKKLKKAVVTVLSCLGLAVLFGLISALSFSISRSLLVEEEQTQRETIIIAQDDTTEASTEIITEAAADAAKKAETSASTASDPSGETSESAEETLTETGAVPAETAASLKNMIEQLQNRIVFIEGYYPQTGETFDIQTTGCVERMGFIVAESTTKWFVLTEAVQEEGITEFEGSMDGKHSAKMTRMGKDSLNNIEIFSVEKSAFPGAETVTLGNSFTVEMADRVFFISNQEAAGLSANEGIVSGVNLSEDAMDGYNHHLYTNMARKADEYGALFDENGELIGWVSDYACRNFEGTSAIGISPLKDMISDVCSGIPLPYLGLYCISLGEKEASLLGIAEGLYVQETVVDSPAFLAGIQPGDRIVQVGGTTLSDGYSLYRKMCETYVGEEIEIFFMRPSGESYVAMKVSVTIGQR